MSRGEIKHALSNLPAADNSDQGGTAVEEPLARI
jgi:hypothetical protein